MGAVNPLTPTIGTKAADRVSGLSFLGDVELAQASEKREEALITDINFAVQ